MKNRGTSKTCIKRTLHASTVQQAWARKIIGSASVRLQCNRDFSREYSGLYPARYRRYSREIPLTLVNELKHPIAQVKIDLVSVGTKYNSDIIRLEM